MLPAGRPLMSARWEHFPHEADMGVRGYGCTKPEALEQAALAMTAVITDVTTVGSRERVGIECEAPDDELLLVEWLNRIIYEMASCNMLFSRFSVRIDGTRLHGEATHSVGVMCRVLKISRSGYYAWVQRPMSSRARQDLWLTGKIEAIHRRSRGAYGSPMITVFGSGASALRG